MQINGIGTDMSLRSATYDSTKATADAKEFSRELQAAANNLRSADSASAPAVGTTAAQLKDKKLRDACQGFEAMFMNLMYTQMRETVPENTLFGESNVDKIMQSMLDTEMMNRASKSGGLGLGDMLYRQLKLADKASQDTARIAQEQAAKRAQK
mgnify:FL=1